MTIPKPIISIEEIMSRSIFTMTYILSYNINMQEPRCIRYFSSLEKAIMAKDLLVKNGFAAEIKEDKFGTVTLDKLGFPLRFRLYAERSDITQIAVLLASKIKK